ncbi:hypothetical protein ACWCO0_20775 [Streptomyces tubercidicus]
MKWRRLPVVGVGARTMAGGRPVPWLGQERRVYGAELRLLEPVRRAVRGTIAPSPGPFAANFFGQMAYQHANATYLTLLGAPVVPASSPAEPSL